MSAQRNSWIVAGLVVLAVGFLVVRSLRSDSATSTASTSRTEQVGGVSAHARAVADSLRKVPKDKREGSVIRAKRVLKEKGFYAGELTANIDQELAEAVRKFQSASGMKPTGYLDKQTYEALGIEFGKRQGANAGTSTGSN